MDTRHKAIRASRFVLSALKPMQRIAVDGPLTISKEFKFILNPYSGLQFVIKALEGYVSLSGVKHLASIPYSKEENGIDERSNKEDNRHIRNTLSDKVCITNWPQMHDGEAAQLVHITAAWSLATLRKRNNTRTGNDGGNGQMPTQLRH